MTMKKAAKAGKVQLFFQDEVGMSNIPNVQRAWSPIGSPHEADASLPRKRVNVLGALNYGTNTLVHTLHEGNVTRDDVVSFVDKLAQQHSQAGIPIIVVLDNASIHCHIDDEKKHEWLMKHKLLLWHIPPYSPELNLIEILWKHAKYHWRKFTSWTKDQLVCEVNKIFCEYGNEFKIDYA
jgi:transposase